MHLIVERKHSVKLFIVVVFVFPEETKVRIQKRVKETRRDASPTASQSAVFTRAMHQVAAQTQSHSLKITDATLNLSRPNSEDQSSY